MSERPPSFDPAQPEKADLGSGENSCDGRDAETRRCAPWAEARVRDIVLRLRPMANLPVMAISGRTAMLLGLLGSGPGAARQLRMTYLLRRDHPLEVSLAITIPLAQDDAAEAASPPLSKRALEVLSRVALPGFAPVNPERPAFRGALVPLCPPRLDVFSGLDPVAPAPGPRPIQPSLHAGLFLPPNDAPTLTVDRALVGLAEAGSDVDLVLEVAASPLNAETLRALTDAWRRLFAATHASGAARAADASAGLARVERWLRAEGAVLRFDAALQFAAGGEAAAEGVAKALIFGAEAPGVRASTQGVDLSRCLLPGLPAPAIALHPLAAADIALIARRRRPRPPKGQVLRLGVDELGRDVAVATDDLRQHAYVVGQTGVGKSTLLKTLALGDAAAGVPVVVIDPHGDLHADLVESLPRQVMETAIVADVGAFDAPFSLNILDVRGPRAAIQRNFIANQLIALFKIIYGSNKEAFGPIFEQFFRSALFLLMDAGGPEASLVELERVFGDAPFRRSLLEKCSDPQVVSFWKNIAHRAGGDLSIENVAGYITSKLAQITGNPLVRPIVCSPRTTLDLPAALAEGRTVLVSLAKGLVGETDAAILGGIITIRLVAAAMARARLPAPERGLTRVILDEFQTYGAHGILSDAMAEVRKYGLSLVLANQSVAQIDGRGADVAHAILGNAGSLLAFRVGPKDAATIAEWLGPEISPQTLMRLPNHTCVARLLRNGVPLPPTVIITSPASGSESAGNTHSEAIYLYVRLTIPALPEGAVLHERRARRSTRQGAPGKARSRRRHPRPQRRRRPMNTNLDASALVALISNMALAAGYTPAEVRAGIEFADRKARRKHPPGHFDKASRFTASERTTPVLTCRKPSRAWPYPEMTAARTAAHCADLFRAGDLLAVKRVAKLRDALDEIIPRLTGSAHERLEVVVEAERIAARILKPIKRTAAAA